MGEFVIAASGSKVPARLEMSWSPSEWKWEYHLQVGGVSVPAYWNKVKGFVSGIAPPLILSGTAGALPEKSPQIDVVESPSQMPSKENPCASSLPRGVSYDSKTQAYQANILEPKTKRYILLGEFPSA